MSLIHPRQIIEKAQSGEPYDGELEPLLRGLSVADPSSLANLTIDYAHRRPSPFFTSPINTEDLKQFALAFHKKAGTDTSEVIRNIDNISCNTPRIRVAHQANLFPSLGVVSQVFLMNALNQRLKEQSNTSPSQLFVIVDYDIAQDPRFRVAHMPNVQGQLGFTPLSGAIPRSLFQNPMWTITKPSRSMVEEWIKKFHSLTVHDLKSLAQTKIFERKEGLIEENLTVLEQIIWEVFERADTLVEFNAFMLSRIVNVYWGMPTAFIFGRELQPSMSHAYEFLIEHWPIIAAEARGAIEFFQHQGVMIKSSIVRSSLEFLPLWITCSGLYNGIACHRRLPLYVASNAPLQVYSHCHQCGTDYRFDLGTYSKVNLDSIRDHGIAPRILIDNLLDALALGIAGGVGYIGQAEHMLLTNYVASRPSLGWEMPPHILWQPRGFIHGLAEYRAVEVTWNPRIKASSKERALEALKFTYFSKASILYYLISLGTQGLLEMWDNFFKEGNSIHSINANVNRSPFRLSAELKNRLESYSEILENKKGRVCF